MHENNALKCWYHDFNFDFVFYQIFARNCPMQICIDNNILTLHFLNEVRFQIEAPTCCIYLKAYKKVNARWKIIKKQKSFNECQAGVWGENSVVNSIYIWWDTLVFVFFSMMMKSQWIFNGFKWFQWMFIPSLSAKISFKSLLKSCIRSCIGWDEKKIVAGIQCEMLR